MTFYSHEKIDNFPAQEAKSNINVNIFFLRPFYNNTDNFRPDNVKGVLIQIYVKFRYSVSR